MSQFHLRPDAARRGPTRLRPQDVASPTRGPTLELLRSHVRPCRFATCFSAARAKADAARRAGPPPPTADPPPTPSHVRHAPTRTPRPTYWPDTSDRAAASAAVARPTWADATTTSDVSARHLRQRGRPRRRRTSDMGRRGRHVPRVGPATSDTRAVPDAVARPTWADATATSDLSSVFFRQVLQRVRRDGLRRSDTARQALNGRDVGGAIKELSPRPLPLPLPPLLHACSPFSATAHAATALTALPVMRRRRHECSLQRRRRGQGGPPPPPLAPSSWRACQRRLYS